jgi:hypothetical protein
MMIPSPDSPVPIPRMTSRTHKVLVALQNTPFSYCGQNPAAGRDILDYQDGEHRGHTSPRGGVRFEDNTYFDKRVLLPIPSGFDPGRQPAIVVFFHGNNATLERDVVRRQQVANQLARSGLNAVLVAPQFAVDTPDSSAGHFWEPRFFRRFLGEAAVA